MKGVTTSSILLSDNNKVLFSASGELKGGDGSL